MSGKIIIEVNAVWLYAVILCMVKFRSLRPDFKIWPFFENLINLGYKLMFEKILNSILINSVVKTVWL